MLDEISYFVVFCSQHIVNPQADLNLFNFKALMGLDNAESDE